MNTQFEIAPDLDTVKKQKNDLEVNLHFPLFFENRISIKKELLPEDTFYGVEKSIKSQLRRIRINHLTLLDNYMYHLLSFSLKYFEVLETH